MKNYNIAAVDINSLEVYDFIEDFETFEEFQKRAEEYNAKNIERYTQLVKDYPNHFANFEKSLERAKNACYKVMEWNELAALKRTHYIDNSELHEITAEEYKDAFNMLPPICWGTRSNCEMFCVSEMIEDTYTTQYAYSLTTGKYYTKIVDARDPKTWINNYLN